MSTTPPLFFTLGSDLLDGTLGSGVLEGGRGDDVYLVDGLDDIVLENPGEGNDSIRTSLDSYLLSATANVERLFYTGSGNFSGSGSEVANTVAGGSGNDSLAGLGGNDVLLGDAGNDTLDGGLGADRLEGGLGNDSYRVDNALDRVIELDGGGDADSVHVAGPVSAWTLAANLENLTYVGSGNFTGNGNAAANRLVGGDGRDTLSGLDGDDSLDGGAGNDLLRGGNGNDSLAASSGDDRFEGGAGSDRLDLQALGWLAASKGSSGANGFSVQLADATTLLLLDASSGQRLTLKGNWLSASLDRGIENFLFDDLALSLDELLDNSASFRGDALFGAADDDRIDGLAGDDTINGGDGNDSLIGGAGNDSLDGGLGADSLDGGAGNDTYGIDAAGDSISDSAGLDSVVTTLTDYSLGSPLERLQYSGSSAFTGRGNALANVIGGNSGNDSLEGGAGNDSLFGGGGDDSLDGGSGADLMNGGAGNDNFIVDNALDRVVDSDGGNDTVRATGIAGFSLGLGLENLVFSGSTRFVGSGNAGNNIIGSGAGNDLLSGLAGDDVIDGGGGRDLINGGFGNDTLVGGDGDDFISGGDFTGFIGQDIAVLGGKRADYVFTRINDAAVNASINARRVVDGVAETDSLVGIEFVVFSDEQVLRTLNASDLLLNSGSAFADNYLDNDLAETAVSFDGLAGNDVARGGARANTLLGGAGNDTLEGGGGNDSLDGGAGNDSLDGGSGDDTLSGGLGDDFYRVDSLGDLVVEGLGQGRDTVRSSRSGYTLTLNVERLEADGAGDFSGSGNDLANTLIGGSGNDSLFGLGGADSLQGGAGNDTLDGGSGADRLEGGAGDDSYVVDTPLDRIVELAGGGNDSVRSSFTLSLGAELENLRLDGSNAINGNGNAGNNILTGNAARNTLNGGLGDDTLDGGADNDLLIGGAGSDTAVFSGAREQYTVIRSGSSVIVTGADGRDTLNGIETLSFADLTIGIEAAIAADNGNSLTLSGSTGDDELNGGSGNDFLNGGAGNDTLDGSIGNDTLVGGFGDDLFIVDSSADLITELAGQGQDTVRVTSLSYSLVGTANVERLLFGGIGNFSGSGGSGNDTIVGGSGTDTLEGGAGNDILDGGVGLDTLTGGLGDDLYLVDSGNDLVLEFAGQGRDTVRTALTSFSLATTANVERLEFTGIESFSGSGNELANTIIGGAGNDNLSGLGGTDSLIGGSGNDTLDGGSGEDRLEGGDGDDTYIVDVPLDVIVESSTGGIDSVRSTFSLTLSVSLENLQLEGSAAINGIGNTNDNLLSGNIGRNTLSGGLGDDTLIGGADNDVLQGGAGTDTAVFSGASGLYTVVRSGTSVVVQGLDGRDTLTDIETLSFADVTLSIEEAIAASPQPVVDLPADVLPALQGGRWGSGGGQTLTYSFMTAIPIYDFVAGIGHPGFRTMNTTERTAVRDVLAQYSRMIDVQFVEVSDAGNGGQLRFGTDRQADSSGFAFLPVDGLDADGDVWINNDPNSPMGYAPGEFGLGTVIHEIGHALGLKHPFEGANRLPGATDNTRYTVMSYTNRSDATVGTGTEFPDGSFTSATDTLSPETPMLYDIAVLQTLYGVSRVATDDIYTPPADRPFFQAIADGGGTDTLDCSAFTRTCIIDLRAGNFSSLGRADSPLDLLPPRFAASLNPTYAGQNNLAIAYGTSIENARGGSDVDVLTGNGVGNALDGRGGNDILSGGSGADFFEFSTALDAATNFDTITDFLGGSDRLRLSAAVFTGLAAGNLAADAFAAGAGLSQAQDAADRIIFDTLSGTLYYDADGSGGAAAIRFALLSGQASITAADFSIV